MKIYVICGHAESGKTTFGKKLKEQLKDNGYKPCIMQITKPLYHYAEDYFEWNPRQDEKPREFLQKLGIEIIRDKLHKDNFLMNRLIDDIEILSHFFNTFIITDARFEREIETIKQVFSDVVVIKIERDNFENSLTYEQKMHTTEIEVDKITNYKYLIKNKTYKELDEEIEKIIQLEEGELL